MAQNHDNIKFIGRGDATALFTKLAQNARTNDQVLVITRSDDGGYQSFCTNVDFEILAAFSIAVQDLAVGQWNNNEYRKPSL